MKKLCVNLFPISFLVVFLPCFFLIPLEGAEISGFQPALSSFVVSPTEAAPGDFLSCHFVFSNQGTHSSTAGEKIFLHFTDRQNPNEIRWQFDHEPLIPTRFWMNGLLVEDGPLPVSIPDTIPDGQYGVRLGVWNPATNQRSLDVILPVTVTIDRNRTNREPVPLQSMTYEAARRQNQALMLQRFSHETCEVLENKRMQLQVQPEKGVFCLRDRETGAFWQSAPFSKGLGYVMAESKERIPIRIPLNQLTVLSSSNKRCVLQKEYNGSVVLEIEIRLESNDTAVTFSWKTGSDWTLYNVEWNGLIWTTDALGGGAVIPRLIGEFYPAYNPIEFQKTFTTYGGWGGLHIPMTGIVQRKNSVMLSWDSPYMTVNLRSQQIDSPEWPGVGRVMVDLLCWEPSGTFRLTPCEGNSYVSVAKAYREEIQKSGMWVSLEEKIKKNADVEKLLGAAEVKPFVCIRYLRDENGKTTERVMNPYTEIDCVQLARHLHGELKLPKILYVLAGWIHRGYDNQHPDILPAAPEIGGDEGLIRISECVRSYGYLFGLHDNYQDMYTDAPSWDTSMIMMDRNGQRMKGGVWAGGQAWLISSADGLQLAHRNLPEIKKLFSPTAYFIDTTFAAPLYESFDPDRPLTRHDDLQFKRELSRFAAGLFGVHGSETGVAFGAPVSHYFEGIMSGGSFIKDFPDPGAWEIPFFPLVFHDSVAMYTHQGDRAGLGDARKILKHLICGEMPLYDIAPHQYWKETIPEPDLTDPNYCFVRCQGGWGENKHPMDRFIKNTYEILSPFAEGVAQLPMIDHHFLKDDRSVELSRFGEHWQVVINYGPENYQFGQTLLPPMGFIALGPDFLAQHFYPKFGEEKTAMIVKRGENTFIAFQ